VDPTSPNLVEAYGQSFLHTHKICFRFQVSCCIFKRVPSKLSDVLNDAKFRTFFAPVKIMGGEGEISIPIFEALTYNPTEPPTVIHCAAAEHGGLIKKEKKERKKFMGKTYGLPD